MGNYEQYLAVRADLKERYPYVDWISIRRRSFNMITADVEAHDLHVTVTYCFKGDRIDDSWVAVGKRKCTAKCIHADYPQENPHRVMPRNGIDDRGINLKRKEGPKPKHWDQSPAHWYKQLVEDRQQG